MITNSYRIFLLCLSFIATMTVQAQQDWDYEWTQYNIVFTLASDFKTITNTADEYTAQGDGMEFAIAPFAESTIDHSDIAAYTLEVAASLKMQEVDDADVLTINGLKGAFVEGYKDGDRVVLLGFIDPSSDTNFFAVITFADDDKVAEEEAVRMIKSIRKK